MNVQEVAYYDVVRCPQSGAMAWKNDDFACSAFFCKTTTEQSTGTRLYYRKKASWDLVAQVVRLPKTSLETIQITSLYWQNAVGL
jgi:hypothetical protein